MRGVRRPTHRRVQTHRFLVVAGHRRPARARVADTLTPAPGVDRASPAKPAHPHLTRHAPQLGLHRLRASAELLDMRVAAFGSTSIRLGSCSSPRVSIPRTRQSRFCTSGRKGGPPVAPGRAVARSGTRTQSSFWSEFSGRERTMADYLLPRRSTMTRPTAALPFTGRDDLKQAAQPLTYRGDGLRGILIELERRSAFIRHSFNRSWYRYHQLFDDLRRPEYDGQQADLAPTLHRTAATWFERTDSLSRRSATTRLPVSGPMRFVFLPTTPLA